MFKSNNLNSFVSNTLDFTQTNYRIWSVFVNADSYLFPPSQHRDNQVTLEAVGITFGVVALFIIIAISVYYYRKRKGALSYKEEIYLGSESNQF